MRFVQRRYLVAAPAETNDLQSSKDTDGPGVVPERTVTAHTC